MPILSIRDVDVDFPYQPYDCQLAYMEKVIRSLQEGGNAMLESPTGTGKVGLCDYFGLVPRHDWCRHLYIPTIARTFTV